MLQHLVAAVALASALADPSSEAEKRCAWDAFQYDSNTCFWSTDELHTWDSAALVTCPSKGMMLASIHSQAENDFVTDMLPSYNSPWIGLYDENHNETFVWSDGTAVDYMNWWKQPIGVEEDCVHLASWSGEWYDLSCTMSAGVLCRGPPDHLP